MSTQQRWMVLETARRADGGPVEHDFHAVYAKHGFLECYDSRNATQPTLIIPAHRVQFAVRHTVNV